MENTETNPHLSLWKGWPDIALLNNFIDLESWNLHAQEDIKRKPPLAWVYTAYVSYDEHPDDSDYAECEYCLAIDIPEDSLQFFMAALKSEDWEFDLEDSELIDGWHENVCLSKFVAKTIAEAYEESEGEW